MNSFCRNLITEWRRLELPVEGQKCLLAISGGADSCALGLAIADLVTLKKLKNEFLIAHFNHRLRGNDSDEDAAWVRAFAQRVGFDIVEGVASEGDISKNNNTEQEARRARYAFLSNAADDLECDLIFTAHTINDQAETFLINLLRGSGIEGLAAMKPVSNLNVIGFDEIEGECESPKPLVRPMLSWAMRSDVTDYLKHKHAEYQNDKMNEDVRFTRVKIRKELIPVMEDLNPNVIRTLARTAALLRADADSIGRIEKKLTRTLLDSSQNLLIKPLLSIPSEQRKRTVRNWLGIRRGGLRRLGQTHIEAICALSTSRKSGRKVELPGGESVIKRNGVLIFRVGGVEKRN